ncbi:hypothetical protein ACFLZY_01655 [Patescibacteria group bacterium]
MQNQQDLKVFSVVILPAVITVFVILFILLPKAKENRTDQAPEQLIGGQRDEHGCLGPAGYGWDKEVKACLRPWELDDNQKKAAAVAVEHLGFKSNVTIVEVKTARCPGCYTVTIEHEKDRVDVDLENWQVKNQSLTPDDCLELGGRTVNTVGGATCNENEENLGQVTGFISPNICCVPQN